MPPRVPSGRPSWWKSCVRGLLRAIGGAGGQRVLVAQRLHDHGARGGDVLVEERRRDLQRGGDVVEAVARFVARQDVGRVDLDAEQVAHGVGVFLAVEAMQAHVARVLVLLAGLVEVAFDPGDELRARVPCRASCGRPAASAACAACARSSRARRCSRDFRFGHRVEGDAAGPVVGVVAFGAVRAEQRPARDIAVIGRRRRRLRRVAPRHAADRENQRAEHRFNARIFHCWPRWKNLYAIRSAGFRGRICDTTHPDHQPCPMRSRLFRQRSVPAAFAYKTRSHSRSCVA